jgi:hypothetical protein
MGFKLIEELLDINGLLTRKLDVISVRVKVCGKNSLEI